MFAKPKMRKAELYFIKYETNFEERPILFKNDGAKAEPPKFDIAMVS